MRLLILLLVFVPLASTLKILLYQTLLGQSHVRFSGVLTDVLVERGHTVDNLLMEWNSNVTDNGTNKARRVIRVRDKNATAFEKTHGSTNMITKKVNLPLSHNCFQETREALCRALLSRRPLIEDLKREKYDVGLTTLFDQCPFGIFHLLGIKSVVGYSPSAEGYKMRELFGIPTPSSFVSDVEDQEIQGDQFTFFQRVKTFYRSLRSESKLSTLSKPIQSLFEEFYPDFPQINDLERNMTFVLVNSHEILDIPKPTSAKIKHIGGITVKRPRPTEKFSPNLEKALSRSEYGAILVSFGSYAKTAFITQNMKHEIVNAFKHFPQYTFIWKFDNPDEDLEIYNKIPNLFRFKWLPQTQLLFDKRIKAFITHGGQHSTLESGMAGVPQIVISLFADQFYTAGCVVRNEQGVRLSKYNITEQALTDALVAVLYDPKYEKQSRRLASIINNYPEQPKDTLVKYVELAAQYPEIGQHLQLAGANMNWFVYSSLDVILFLIFAMLAFTLFTMLIFRLPKYLLDRSKEEDVYDEDTKEKEQ